MKSRCVRTVVSSLTIAFGLCFAMQSVMAAKIRIGEAGVLSVDKLVELVALEYAKQRGFDYTLTALKSDDICKEAFLSNQIDVVIGTNAYRLIQKLKVPAHHFIQLRMLSYVPVVAKASYKSWADLNGQDFVVHARGSGTEVLARQMEAAHKIKFKSISYVPGAPVRANGLLRGTIKATYLNIPSLQFVMKKAPGKFMVLPAGKESASDAAVFARTAFIAAHKAQLQIFVDELLKVIRKTNADPTFIVAERNRLHLMPDLPKDQAAGLLSFFKAAAETGLYPDSGGDETAVKSDFKFYAASGDLTGNPADLKVADYWDLSLVKAADKTLGAAK